MTPAKPQDWNFETLNAESPGGGYDTFTYWLGVLSVTTAPWARDGDEACGQMSYQYDVEEQVDDDLEYLRETIPSALRPVAPVTLALRWSPFPAAFSALGDPVRTDRGRYGKVLAIFRPMRSPSFTAAGADERHFLFLLRHCCERAADAGDRVFLCGSPGWSYTFEDVAILPRVQLTMKRFGFVYCDRKPEGV